MPKGPGVEEIDDYPVGIQARPRGKRSAQSCLNQQPAKMCIFGDARTAAPSWW